MFIINGKFVFIGTMEKERKPRNANSDWKTIFQIIF